MSSSEAWDALRRSKRILLDSNLLLLVMLGAFDRSLITRFKRTQIFSLRHYAVMEDTLAAFSELVTTPHILTEVSNLANSLPAGLKYDWGLHFAGQIKLFTEATEPSHSIAQHKLFPEFGLTDAAIASLTQDTFVLTEDGRLAARLNERHFCAVDLQTLSTLQEWAQSGRL